MSPGLERGLGLGGHPVATEQIRLLTKVARMYHERGLRQPEIAELLHISQSRVSRLLKQAVTAGIVRTTVVTPRGVHAELEEAVEQRFGLTEVVVADTEGLAEEGEIVQAIGSAAAVYLETTLSREDRVGISSWSETLLATVDAMHMVPTLAAERVVQILGGVGTSTAAQNLATRLTSGLARNTKAEAVYLVAPGLVATQEMRDALIQEPGIAAVFAAYEDLTVALVGVGSLEPSNLLRASGNAMAEQTEAALRELGAIGDVCLRFYDAEGAPVASEMDDRVLGIGAETLRKVPRRIGVAGGKRKRPSIRAALTGGWVNVLVTDQGTAAELADAPI